MAADQGDTNAQYYLSSVTKARRLARQPRSGPQAATKTPPARDPALAHKRIVRVQRSLASLGYDPGPADGVMGHKTRAAIRAFRERMGLPVTGEISGDLEIAIRAAKRTIASIRPPPPSKPQPVPPKKITGSGIIVSTAGHVLTNAHIVDRCRTISAATGSLVETAGIAVGPRRQSAAPFKAPALKVVNVDTQIDLALLKSAGPVSVIAAFRDGRGVRTGESVIVAGFPLPNLLSTDLNVTQGIVSALAGPENNRRLIQITAPVQPGNSGGPVLDASGHVVGVVVSRLDAIKMARRTGRLPQNVNFAISEGAVRAFLDAHDVPYKTARSDRTMPTVDIAAKAKGYTVLLKCRK